MLMNSNKSLKDDSDSRDGIIHKATIITLVRVVKLAITTKDVDQALPVSYTHLTLPTILRV